MDVLERLKEAISTGEVLKIKYHGGSQSGSIRDIAPISVKSDKIRARCYESNAVKTFLIRKIEILTGGAAQQNSTWSKNKEKIINYISLEQFTNEILYDLKSLGWHVQYDKTSLSLHRCFKNGKPLKSSDVAISFNEFDHDYVLNEYGEVQKVNERKRLRPWVVRAKYMNTVTYGKLDRIVPIFLAQAIALAPK